MRYRWLESRAEEAMHSTQLRCDLDATRSSKEKIKSKPGKNEEKKKKKKKKK
jgi:hypothetical protein